ncbi:hypothetical protein FQN60_011475, partial [Etheostoma spectabile]
MVKLSAELIEQAAQYTNPVRDRELDLRARTWLHACNFMKCFSSRIGENLEQSLQSLTELVLTSNNIQELGDLDPLASVKTLTLLSLLRNPVTNKKHYRLYVINKIPQIRVLDFQKVKLKERQEAEKMFKGKRGAQLAKDIARRTKTFTPGVAAQLEKKRTGPSQADVEAIKVHFLHMVRFNILESSGKVEGNSLKNCPADMVEEEEEEEEEDDTAQMESHMDGGPGEEMNDGDQEEEEEDMNEEPQRRSMLSVSVWSDVCWAPAGLLSPFWAVDPLLVAFTAAL